MRTTISDEDVRTLPMRQLDKVAASETTPEGADLGSVESFEDAL
jgi:hypothetical protein